MASADPWPFNVVDTEADPPYVVASYGSLKQAEFHIEWLHRHGGSYIEAKVERGGYRIDGPGQ